MSLHIGTHRNAKFQHEGGLPVRLRLQAFVTVRDGDGRVALLRLREAPDVLLLQGELMQVNEHPDEAAERVAKSWFESDLKDLKLASIENYPATGGDDTSWYMIFRYEAKAAGELKGTPDTMEIKWARPGEDVADLGFAHRDVWERIR